MKIESFIFFLICIIFIPFSLESKPKKPKIETYEITCTKIQWWYCYDGNRYNENCIEKMRLTFENQSQYRTSGLSFWIEIRDSNDNILYRRKHTASLQLDPGEVGSTEEFYLYEQVFWYDPDEIYISVISVW